MLTINRGGWTEYEHLFESQTDEEISTISGKSLDAVRLKRKRISDPRDGYVGLDIVFFDTESTGLTAIMGRLLCASFCDSWGRIETYRVDETQRETVIDDRALAVMIRDRLEKADIICGWYSKMHDVPFINARLMRWGERPLRKDLMHIDAFYFSRGSFVRIGSSKLVNVQKFLPDIEHEKTDISWDIWNLAGAGDKESLDYVVEHCEADILVLREVFGKLKPHITNIHR